MAKNINAFPFETVNNFDFPISTSSGLTVEPSQRFIGSGMSLRDYFAAKAMQALVSAGQNAHARVSRDAYELADAMLEARE